MPPVSRAFICLSGDVDPDGIGRLVEFGVNGQPGAGGGGRDGLHDQLRGWSEVARASSSRCGRTSGCSILFHLLVPGGRWHTVIVSPVSGGGQLGLPLPGAIPVGAAAIER